MSQLPIDPAALSTALATAMQTMGGDDGDFQFMKMTKAGEFMFGADETEVQEGSLWAIDPRSIVLYGRRFHQVERKRRTGW